MLASNPKWRRIYAPFLLVTLFLCFDAAVIFHFSLKQDIALYLACFAVLCICQFALSGQIDLSRKQILFLSLAVKLPLVFSAPFLSDDIYRYVWDGIISTHGINPYAHPPNSANLAEFAAGYNFHALINHPQLATLYLPALQVVFALAAALGGELALLKLIFLAFDVAAFFVLAELLPKNTQSKALLIFAFHPLILMETYSSGHFEIIFVFFVLLMLHSKAREHRRDFFLGTLLGVLTKGFNILYLFYSRRWLATLTLSAAVLSLSLALLTSSEESGLTAYHGQFSFNNPIYRFFHFFWMESYHGINAVLPYAAFNKGLTLLVVSAASLLCFRPVRQNFERFVLFITCIVIFASSTIHPWYLIILVPLSLLCQNKTLLALTYTTSLAYVVLIGYFETGTWQENDHFMWIVYAPLLLVLLYKRQFK